MRAYVEIGRRMMWRRKQYRCVEFEDYEIGDNCEVCGLRGDRLACKLTACTWTERADKKNVFFRLEPRFRKEEKQ